MNPAQPKPRQAARISWILYDWASSPLPTLHATFVFAVYFTTVIAPENGIVFELQPKGPGYVAQTSQPVLKIVPTENLLAKVDIDSRTIGFVQVGKKVDISIDSFPATDFGVIEGILTKIGSDTLPPDRSQGKGYRYPAEITLNNQYLNTIKALGFPILI